MNRSPILVITLISAGLLCTGCCSQYVNNLGRTTAGFTPVTALRDDHDNIIIQTELYRRSMNNHKRTYPLGTRYVILSASGVNGAVESAINGRRVFTDRDRRRVQIGPQYNASLPATEQESSATSGWQVYPGDLLTKFAETTLPSHVRQNRIVQMSPHYAGGRFSPSFDYTVSNTVYSVEVSMGAPLREESHLDKWAYPLKALFVPAVVVDVVTYPLQFLWFMHEWGSWSDGSGR